MRKLPLLLWEKHRLWVLLLFSILAASDVLGAPPANDDCAGAVVIPSNATLPYLTPILTNINEATRQTTDPEPGCIIGATNKNVWYRFTPSVTGIYTFSTGDDTATTAFDTILSVYAAPNGCGAALTEVACNDDSGAANNRAGLAVTNMISGLNYFIMVSLSQADDENPLGALSLQIRVDRPRPPSNDTCATPEVIRGDLGFPQKSSIIETFVAGTEDVLPEPSCTPNQFRSVWFKFTPPASGTYIFSTGSETATTVFDTTMVLYSTTSDCNSLTEVTCSANGEARGSIFRALTGGTMYYIAIFDETDPPIVSESIVQLSVATPTVPTVVTLPVVSISSTAAVLCATINPNGLQSRFWFEWGPTTAYNSTSQVRLLFPTTAPVMTNQVVQGFAANTTYHYRAVATNNLGRMNGIDQTFIWTTNGPVLINPERFVSGNFRFAFDANPYQLYAVESSTDLENWTGVGLAGEMPAGSGHFVFTHVGAGSALWRFYRVNAP